MSVTIEQIARRAGVSPSTAARILRGDFKGLQQRSIAKAKEVQRISQELGYHPNWRARALSRGKTRTIGLLYDDPMWIFEDPMNEIAVSFTASLQRLKYDLRLIPVSGDQHWKELVYGGAVDGVAFLVNIPQAAGEVVSDARIPVVLVGDAGDAPHIVPDDEAGGYLATRHLLGLGHKRVAYYVSDAIRAHYSVDARRNGYKRAMREAGLAELIDDWHCHVDEAMGRLLGPDSPTALICYCHVEALHISHAAWSHGLAIPTDLSVIAFNDMAVTQFMTPPLTVVGFDTAEMGRLGAEMLTERIEGVATTHPDKVTLRQRLVVRSTTAPPGTRPRAV
ncbi:MAG: LacI family DNA-binding transcriptional regulator [Planctomycetales bacterium]|nr:LacI family DNA-binding transcriptional regulator [Planctomycetales bacterium]